MKKQIELGQEVIDVVSGYKGIVIARSEYLNGCTRCGVQAKIGKDGKLQDCCWFDEPQLKPIGKGIKIKSVRRDTGGPVSSLPTRMNDPK